MSSCKVLTELFCLSETLVTFFFTFDEMLCYAYQRNKKRPLCSLHGFKFLKKVVMITCYAAYAYATFDTFSFKTKFSKYFQIEIGGRI